MKMNQDQDMEAIREEKGKLYWNLKPEAKEFLIDTMSDCYPLFISMLKALDNEQTFDSWVKSIPSDLIEKYNDNEDGDVRQDIQLCSMFWLFKLKGNRSVGLSYQELHAFNQIVKTLLAQLSLLNTFSKTWPDTKFIELCYLNSKTWNPMEIFIQSYLKHTETVGDEQKGTIDEEVQARYSLWRMAEKLFKNKKKGSNE
jgi:hypothetical protein